uniref:Uncharacterized protein n=1 Tax=Arundo donax TaxID=35708 RepID=A0A0A9HNZ4_ARUDO
MKYLYSEREMIHVQPFVHNLCTTIHLNHL